MVQREEYLKRIKAWMITYSNVILSGIILVVLLLYLDLHLGRLLKGFGGIQISKEASDLTVFPVISNVLLLNKFNVLKCSFFSDIQNSKSVVLQLFAMCLLHTLVLR